MMRLLRFLLMGDSHLHNWELHKTLEYTKTFSNGNEHDLIEYHCRCTVCGKMKVFGNNNM